MGVSTGQSEDSEVLLQEDVLDSTLGRFLSGGAPAPSPFPVCSAGLICKVNPGLVLLELLMLENV